MELLQRTVFCQLPVYFFESFVPVLEPLIKSWFDVPSTQMPILILLLRAGVLFEGAFPLRVSVIQN